MIPKLGFISASIMRISTFGSEYYSSTCGTLGLVFAIVFLAGIAAFAQSAQWHPSVGPDAGDEEARVKQVVDRIMHPYLSRNYIPGAIVGVSLQGRRYFFSFGQATHAGAPFTADTLVE